MTARRSHQMADVGMAVHTGTVYIGTVADVAGNMSGISAFGYDVIIGDPARDLKPEAVFAALLSYPGSSGEVRDWRGVIEGGTAKNIIPRRCAFQWETRLLPTADPAYVPHRFAEFSQRLEPAMKQVAPDTGIATETVNQVPGLAPEKDSAAENLALHLAEANSTHAVSYCTEAGLFQQIGIPAVICGPGSIEQAHKPDEYIDISELRKCEAFMGKLVSQLS